MNGFKYSKIIIELILSSSDEGLIEKVKTLFNSSPKVSPKYYKEIDQRKEAYQKDKSTSILWAELK